eukprot:CAMPEP_0170817526 /NCGR_PEP_ID=MMETSP0733-20121128/40080_1 /TAXON_ID=186038 /ORGANISM="Fragilariopsis kerguelensis, Strain L26-C5" /LENGTH=53 /DNA_ID=CAMNT_0011177239 /DNA_START=67 /DNA_END=225 /DNA_ORIENTATION=-
MDNNGSAQEEIEGLSREIESESESYDIDDTVEEETAKKKEEEHTRRGAEEDAK